jgi:hypothetical protein
MMCSEPRTTDWTATNCKRTRNALSLDIGKFMAIFAARMANKVKILRSVIY